MQEDPFEHEKAVDWRQPLGVPSVGPGAVVLKGLTLALLVEDRRVRAEEQLVHRKVRAAVAASAGALGVE